MSVEPRGPTTEELRARVLAHETACASHDRLHDPGPEGDGTFDERGWYHPLCDCKPPLDERRAEHIGSAPMSNAPESYT